MQNLRLSRYSLLLFIVLAYLIPQFALSYYAGDWQVFSAGLVVAMGGSTALYLLMCNLESSTVIEKLAQPIVNPIPVATESHSSLDFSQEMELKETIAMLQTTVQERTKELENKANELDQAHDQLKRYEDDATMLQQELQVYRENSQEQIQQQQRQFGELQQTIADKTALTDKLQQRITALEAREKDLSYEIKTLVSLSNYEATQVKEAPKPLPLRENKPNSNDYSGIPPHLRDLPVSKYQSADF